MISITGLFAYAGPDTFLPLTSAISALAGVVMFLWSRGPRSILSSLGARLRPRGRAQGPVRGTWRGPTPAREGASDTAPR